MQLNFSGGSKKTLGRGWGNGCGSHKLRIVDAASRPLWSRLPFRLVGSATLVDASATALALGRGSSNDGGDGSVSVASLLPHFGTFDPRRVGDKVAILETFKNAKFFVKVLI
jgi:hypothetical protein